MQIQKLDHFTIIVSDLESSREFYEGLLGLDVLPHPNFDFQGMWFGNGDLQVHAILENENSGPAGLQRRERGRPSRHLHFAFQVSDFDAAFELVRSAAPPVKILDGPKARPDGIRQLFIADPDGYVIELCE